MNKAENEIAKLFEDSVLSASQISKLIKWLQSTPKTTTIRVNLLGVSTDEVVAHILKMFKQCTHLPCQPLIERFDPIPEIIMIHSIDQHLINKKPCSEKKEVVVDVPCGTAVLRGAHIYCPGILAMQSNTKLNEIVNIFADIEGACKKGTNVLYNSPQKLFIGIGKVKMQRHQLFGTAGPSKGIAVEVHQTISYVPSVGSEYLTGQNSLLQNFPSIVCSRVLDPKPHEIVLDMCASPGNKTTHLAQLMEDTGLVVALDKSAKRVSVLMDNINRFNLKSVRCYTFDATKAVDVTNQQNNGVTSHPPYAEESFDKILLDAPCSGLGNRPILTTRLNNQVAASFPKLQKKLLDAATKLLKVGGVLVYSTCSVLEAENELNVVYMLQKYGKILELETATPMFGNQPGLSSAGLTDDERRKVQRFGPNLEEMDNDVNMEDEQVFIDSTGFFICKFRKIAKFKED